MLQHYWLHRNHNCLNWWGHPQKSLGNRKSLMNGTPIIAFAFKSKVLLNNLKLCHCLNEHYSCLQWLISQKAPKYVFRITVETSFGTYKRLQKCMHILQQHILGWLYELHVICVLMHACVKSLSNVLPFKFLERYIHLFECKHRHVGANVLACNHRGFNCWMWLQGQKKSNQQCHSLFSQSIHLPNFFVIQLLYLSELKPN